MKAIVFDKSGTIVDTCRVALDLSSDEIKVGVSSTRIVDDMKHGALLILDKSKSDLILSSTDTQDFSSFCKDCGLSLKCVYSSKCDQDVCIDVALDRCSIIPMSKFKQTINALFNEIGEERTNCGIIYDFENDRPHGVLTTGGRLYDGVRELFEHLKDEGWDIYIATGDTLSGMRELSQKLDLPCCRIFCFQDEPRKAESIKELKKAYETVVMVGNDSNDMMAFREADVSILVLQDGHEKRKELFEVADHVVERIGDIKDIL